MSDLFFECDKYKYCICIDFEQLNYESWVVGPDLNDVMCEQGIGTEAEKIATGLTRYLFSLCKLMCEPAARMNIVMLVVLNTNQQMKYISRLFMIMDKNLMIW